MKRDYRLETRQARTRLPCPEDREPYWRQIHTGLFLGYRKTDPSSAGVWIVRFKSRKGHYRKKTLAEADDFKDCNKDGILSYKEALEKAMSCADRSFVAAKPLTVRQAAEDYLAWFKDHRKSYEGTYASVHAHILPTFGDTLVEDLKTADIKAWLNKLAATPARVRSKKGKKQAFKEAPKNEAEKRARKTSANRTLAILKAILNKAFQDERVADDITWRRVKPFGKVDEPITRFLNSAEGTRLINAAREDFRKLVRGALFTGARYSELAGLKVKDVKIDTGHVYIQPSKSGRGRHIPLSPDGRDFFKRECLGKTGEALVLTKQDGTEWGRNHHSRLLEDACETAKIKPAIGFHELRHTYASLLAQDGVDLLTISKLLGHSDTRITSRHYAHLCDKTLSDAVTASLPSFGYKPESKVAALR